MPEELLMIPLSCFLLAVGHLAGYLAANRKHRRDNAATAQCAACEWTSGPVPLSDAFMAAHGHHSTEHPAMVVKA